MPTGWEVRALSTTPSRTVSSSLAYAPFGETYVETGTPDQSFTGQNQDTVQGNAAGLYDFLYREYHPVSGRWVSPDPAGLAAVDLSNPRSLNRYAYVINDPNDWLDPLGLRKECAKVAAWNGEYWVWSAYCVDYPWEDGPDEIFDCAVIDGRLICPKMPHHGGTTNAKIDAGNPYTRANTCIANAAKDAIPIPPGTIDFARPWESLAENLKHLWEQPGVAAVATAGASSLVGSKFVTKVELTVAKAAPFIKKAGPVVAAGRAAITLGQSFKDQVDRGECGHE